jgi:hypothetical protein
MKPVELDATRRRLSACHNIDDLRAMGRRLTPRPVFDYVDGGADEELSMAANLKAFRRWRFQPRALPEIVTADTSARLLDRDLPLPLALAPTGYTRMMHPTGCRTRCRRWPRPRSRTWPRRCLAGQPTLANLPASPICGSSYTSSATAG